MKKRNIAVVGAGNWGRNLIRNFSELNTLAAVSDNSLTTLKEIQNFYPECKIYPTLKDVLSNPDVEAIAIATPAETHYLLTREAMPDRQTYLCGKIDDAGGKRCPETY